MFTCYGTYIKGITLELQPNKLIVQAWRSRDWPRGTYSIVAFRLTKAAGGRTTLRFLQVGCRQVITAIRTQAGGHIIGSH